jgi:hypothetical protein
MADRDDAELDDAARTLSPLSHESKYCLSSAPLQHGALPAAAASCLCCAVITQISEVLSGVITWTVSMGSLMMGGRARIVQVLIQRRPPDFLASMSFAKSKEIGSSIAAASIQYHLQSKGWWEFVCVQLWHGRFFHDIISGHF